MASHLWECWATIMAMLQVLKGPRLKAGQQFAIELDTTVLGRHPECQIVLEVGAVSRRHAQIIRQGQSYYIEDLGSRNGTQLNGRNVEGRQLLQENDRVKVCDSLFTFHHAKPGQVPSPPSDPDAPVGVPVAPHQNLTVDDDRPGVSSTIMSTLDLGDKGLRVAVKPEVILEAFLEITQGLANTLAIEEVLPKILESLFRVFLQADRGFILLVDPKSGTLLPKAFKHRRNEDEQVRLSRTIINQVMQEKKAILSADAASDTRFDMAQSVADFRIRSMMCVPMLSNDGQVVGILQLDTQDQMQRFEQRDLDLLASVAAQARVAVENAQLHESLIEQEVLRERTKQEREAARTIQRGFLPSMTPTVPGYQFFHYYQPAREVGGDYFGYVPLQGNRLALVQADVAGKGVPAALLMAKLASDVRYCLAIRPTAAEAVDLLNDGFNSDNWEDKFVTLVLYVIDLNTHEVTIVNAGHNAPTIRRVDGRVEELDEVTGFPLGVAEGIGYEQFSIVLQPGESLTTYTDGFSDAMNENREMYTVERLKEKLSSVNGSAEAIGEALLAEVWNHIGTTPQFDDMCLVVFSRLMYS